PAAAFNRHLEGKLAQRAVGDDVPAGDGLAVDDHFDRDFARAAEARPLDIPVRLLVVTQFADRFIRLLIEPRRDLRRHAHGFGFAELHLAALHAGGQPVDAEIHQMAFAVRDVSPAGPHAVNPRVVIQLPVQPDIAAPQANALTVNAG